MSGLTIEQLQEQLRQLRNSLGMLVKEGTILYIHPVQQVTDKFSKISVGMDCSEEIQGRRFTSYLEFQIPGFFKELMSDFDVKAGTSKYKVGDKIRVKCTVEGQSINKDKKNGDRDVIYMNVTLSSVKMVTPADGAAPVAQGNVTNDAEFFNEETKKDDTPF